MNWLAEAYASPTGLGFGWVASLAIEHGATLVSFDRDFERFAGLHFEPLR